MCEASTHSRPNLLPLCLGGLQRLREPVSGAVRHFISILHHHRRFQTPCTAHPPPALTRHLLDSLPGPPAPLSFAQRAALGSWKRMRVRPSRVGWCRRRLGPVLPPPRPPRPLCPSATCTPCISHRVWLPRLLLQTRGTPHPEATPHCSSHTASLSSALRHCLATPGPLSDNLFLPAAASSQVAAMAYLYASSKTWRRIVDATSKSSGYMLAFAGACVALPYFLGDQVRTLLHCTALHCIDCLCLPAPSVDSAAACGCGASACCRVQAACLPAHPPARCRRLPASPACR